MHRPAAKHLTECRRAASPCSHELPDICVGAAVSTPSGDEPKSSVIGTEARAERPGDHLEGVVVHEPPPLRTPPAHQQSPEWNVGTGTSSARSARHRSTSSAVAGRAVIPAVRPENPARSNQYDAQPFASPSHVANTTVHDEPRRHHHGLMFAGSRRSASDGTSSLIGGSSGSGCPPSRAASSSTASNARPCLEILAARSTAPRRAV